MSYKQIVTQIDRKFKDKLKIFILIFIKKNKRGENHLFFRGNPPEGVIPPSQATKEPTIMSLQTIDEFFLEFI